MSATSLPGPAVRTSPFSMEMASLAFEFYKRIALPFVHSAGLSHGLRPEKARNSCVDWHCGRKY